MSKFWLWVHKNVEKSIQEKQQANAITGVTIGGSGKFYAETTKAYPTDRDEKCTAENFGSQNGFTFQVYPGRGGAVVKRTKYDVRSDRHDCTLYIVSNEDDTAKAIGEIVSMEMMRGE